MKRKLTGSVLLFLCISSLAACVGVGDGSSGENVDVTGKWWATYDTPTQSYNIEMNIYDLTKLISLEEAVAWN